MRILMIGAGAVGGYFGARLALAGRDVTFLVREARAAQLAHGLHLRSPHGDATLTPRLLTAPALAAHPQPFDVVLISTKAYSLSAAMQDFAPAVGPATAIIPLQNGMRQLDELSARFPAGQVLGGSVRIIGDLLPGGEVHQGTDLGEMTFGPRPDVPGQAERFDLQALLALLSAPGMVTLLVPDVYRALWQKWWILASMNGICILAGGSLGDAVSTPQGPEFAEGVLAECTDIATANGYPPDAVMLADHRSRFHPACTLTTSMYRDMSRGLPVEADHIFGDLLRRANGVPAPRLQAAYTRLKVYEVGQGTSKTTLPNVTPTGS